MTERQTRSVCLDRPGARAKKHGPCLVGLVRNSEMTSCGDTCVCAHATVCVRVASQNLQRSFLYRGASAPELGHISFCIWPLFSHAVDPALLTSPIHTREHWPLCPLTFRVSNIPSSDSLVIQGTAPPLVKILWGSTVSFLHIQQSPQA